MKELSTPLCYRKTPVKVPDGYPSLKLEWQYKDQPSPTAIDVFGDWVVGEEMLRFRKIVAGKNLTENDIYLREKSEGNYVDYIFRTLLFKYWGKAEYKNGDGDFSHTIEENSEKIKKLIKDFIQPDRQRDEIRKMIIDAIKRESLSQLIFNRRHCHITISKLK